MILSLIVHVHNGLINISISIAFFGGIVNTSGLVLISYLSHPVFVLNWIFKFLFDLFPIHINCLFYLFTAISVLISSSSK